MMQRLFLISWLIVFSFTAIAQRHTEVDSLYRSLALSKNDTVKARTYNQLFNLWVTLDADSALHIAKIGLLHTQKMNWQKAIAVFLSNIGRVFSDGGNYDSAMYYFNKGLQIELSIGEKRNAASTYNNMGNAANNILSNYPLASSYYFKALKQAEEIKDSILLITCLNNIAGIYQLQKDFSTALVYAKKAFVISSHLYSVDDMINSLNTMGIVTFSTKDTIKAKANFNQAYILAEKNSNLGGMANALNGLALCFGNDYAKVIATRIKAQQLWNEVNPLHPDAVINTGNLGIAYLDIARFDSLKKIRISDIPWNKQIFLDRASAHLTAAIKRSEQIGNMDNKSYFLGELAAVQELQGNFKNAFYNYKFYSETQDSLYSQESKNKIAAAEAQSEMDKKNAEIHIHQLQLANQRKTIYLFAGGLVLLGIIGFLFYWQALLRKKSNSVLTKLNKELDEANKVKTKFFAILSHDLRSPVANLISFLKLQKNSPDLLSAQQIEDRENKISTSAQSLLETMESMLLWSKGQMEQFKPVITTVPASKLFIYLQNYFTHSPNITLNFINDGDVQINTDPDYLKTIMQNLTANAIKALQQTTAAQITWKAWQQNNTIYLSITDNGPGISSGQAKALFDDTHITGTRHGLGLHIIRDLAKAISCRINIIPDNKQGTAFVLVL